MKASILLLLILGVAAAAVPEKVLHRSKRDLTADLNDFIKVYPYEFMSALKRYLEHDKEIQAIFTNFDADHIKALISKLLQIPEVLQLGAYLLNAGVNMQAIFGSVYNLVDVAKATQYISPDDGSAPTGGLSGFIKEITAALPQEKLHDLYTEKLKTSTDFAKMVAAITSTKFDGYITAIGKTGGYLKIVAEIGADVLKFFPIYKSLVGIQ